MAATQTTVAQQASMEATCKAADKYPRYADVIGRAGELLLAGKVERIGEDRYRVQSRTRPGREYLVTPQSCGCEWFDYSGRGCVHQWSACYLLEIAETRAAVLNDRERRRLTLYKWTYAMESAGFSQQEAKRLIFARLRAQRNGETAQRQEVA